MFTQNSLYLFFLVIFGIMIIKITIIIIIATIIIIIGIVSVICIKQRFWRPKKRYKLPERGGRGGNSDNTRKKTFIFMGGVPQSSHKELLNVTDILRYFQVWRASAIYVIAINWQYTTKDCDLYWVRCDMCETCEISCVVWIALFCVRWVVLHCMRCPPNKTTPSPSIAADALLSQESWHDWQGEAVEAIYVEWPELHQSCLLVARHSPLHVLYVYI